MASFGVVNATVAGGVHRAVGVSAYAVKVVSIVGNVSSLAGLLLPILTYVVPVWNEKGLGSRTIWWFIAGIFSSLLWLLYTIPAKHRDTFVLVVNCVGLAVQVAYVGYFLKFTAGQNRKNHVIVVIIAGTGVLFVAVFFVTVVILTRTWSVKVIGIFAATYSTAMFVGGIVDVVMMVTKQVSGFNIWQLMTNLEGAMVWTSFGFLFKPIIFYTVIPNVAGVAVILVQIVCYAVLHYKAAGNNVVPAPGNNASAPAPGNGGDGTDARGNHEDIVAAPTNTEEDA